MSTKGLKTVLFLGKQIPDLAYVTEKGVTHSSTNERFRLLKIKINKFRKDAIPGLAGFHARSILAELEFGDVSFCICGGWKTGEPREKPSEQGEN